ncbi:MAG: hypothetical protein COA58_04605 [Bacteroidetes bacterium]|nr:MAG: hypothetical protein COA58_04605 [Bacteroidota bacterium]
MNRKNKDVAGFQILNILAEIDGDFDPKEGQIIVEYVAKNFPLGGNLESAMDELSQTAPEDYPILLQKCAEDFYADSVEKERLELIDFALRLLKADDVIDAREDWLINKLYQYWDIN